MSDFTFREKFMFLVIYLACASLMIGGPLLIGYAYYTSK